MFDQGPARQGMASSTDERSQQQQPSDKEGTFDKPKHIPAHCCPSKLPSVQADAICQPSTYSNNRTWPPTGTTSGHEHATAARPHDHGVVVPIANEVAAHLTRSSYVHPHLHPHPHLDVPTQRQAAVQHESQLVIVQLQSSIHVFLSSQ